MDAEYLKRIITDQERETEENLKKRRIIKREFLEEVGKELKKPNAVIIAGVRRCGKSTAALLLLEKKRYAHVNFDDPGLSDFSASDFKPLDEAIASLKGDVENMLLDEIQNVRGWELYASKLRNTKKVIITGSNSRLLSGELATRLTGRYVMFTAFPFSFSEFLSYGGVSVNPYATPDIAKAKKYLIKYLSIGGFPEASDLGVRYLLQVYDDILTKDVEARFNIRKYRAAFRDMAKYLILNTSNETSYSKLKNIFGIASVNTVKNYLAFLENAYLLFRLDRYSPKLKERMLSPKKIYCTDTGMASALGMEWNEDKSRLVETAVAIELQRRRSYFNPRAGVYYWKDYQQHEVDFVVVEGGKARQLIQVSYKLGNEKVRKREMTALLKASEELRCNDLLIITWDEEGVEEESRKKVRVVPLWKWLLDGMR